MGSLTAGVNLPIGSAIGQVSEAQPAAINLLQNSFAPQLAPWVLNGAAGFPGLSQGDQWDANFIPATFSSTGVAADFADNPTVAPTGLGPHTIQAQFSSIGTSTFARVGINWTGGVPRLDSVDFNPKTGQVLAASAGVAAVKITQFNSINASTQNIVVTLVTFTTIALPAGTVAGDFRLFPSLSGGAATVVAGGFQVEAGVNATSFIGTPVGSTATRPFGVTPRMSTDRTIPQTAFAANYAYQPQLDNGRLFNTGTNGLTFTLPNGVGSANPGEWCDIYFSGTTFLDIIIGGGGAIQGPGLASVGIAAVRIPYDGANNPAGGVGLYNVCGVRAICLNALTWKLETIALAKGEQLFTANGTFNARQGMTTAWVDGGGGGGGGGGAAASNSGAGGGASGDTTTTNALTTVPGTAYSITLGTAGSGGAAGNNNGTAGGNTTFGALLTLNGGNLGTGAGTGATGVGGASVGNNSAGGSSGFVQGVNFAIGGTGGACMWGAPPAVTIAGNAAQSVGGAGQGFSSGGDGGASGNTGAAVAGGNGRPGFIAVRW